MTDPETLHRLVDALPESHRGAVEDYLRALLAKALADLHGKASSPPLKGVQELYDADFDAWAQAQAAALRAKNWAALDFEHLAEEVEELRKTERKAVRSQLRRLTSHLLKWAYQPARRSDSWQATITDARRLVADWLEEDGSLTQELPALFAWAYPRARREAAKDTRLPLATFPEDCPWLIEQVLDEDFWPEA
jgi:Domain of unknown function DUF29